ncbi:hypothetical protein BDC45DRAFT_583895 [Circinella umbellata]|nr:hypothetical protein BDC45DRAFT_583895 [Circinella umbellata]
MVTSTIFDNLPFEINSLIFSLISRRDCIEFMCTSHRWFGLVPEMTKSLWKDIDFSLEPCRRKNICMQQCFGSHVQKAHVIAKNMDYIMAELISRQCNIKELEILDGVNEMKYIPRLLKVIQFVGDNLCNLTLNHHENGIPLLLEIGRMSTQLKYLRVIVPKSRLLPRFSQRHREKLNSTEPLFSSLMFFSLQYDLNSQGIESILKESPNLRYLQLAPLGEHSYYTTQNNGDVDFTRILHLCPYLEHFECSLNTIYSLSNGNLKGLNFDASTIIENNYTSNSNILARQQLQQHMLRQFICYTDMLIPRIGSSFLPFLQNIQDKLTVLYINQGHSDFFQNREADVTAPSIWSNLAKLKFKHIQQLTIIHSYINSATISHFIGKHSKSLKKISLGMIPPMLNGQLIQALATCSKLVELSLHVSYRNQDPNRWAYSGTEIMPVVFPSNYYLLGNLQYLQQFEISGAIVLSISILHIISKIRQLKRVLLSNYNCHECINREIQTLGSHYHYYCYENYVQLAELTTTRPHLITKSDLLHFIKTISQHSNLQHLTIRNLYSFLDEVVINSISSISTVLCYYMCYFTALLVLTWFIEKKWNKVDYLHMLYRG